MEATLTHNRRVNNLLLRLRPQRGLAFAVIILAALLAFEVFNYSTTDFALADLLGDLSFLGVSWSTILAIAFCGIDFAGIARLFTPQEGGDEPNEIWYLFAAWLLAATMNAMLTWWGVSIAILEHQSLGSAVVERDTLLRVVPIFVAVLVWLIRVLIIGSFSVAGERLFSQAERPPARRRGVLPVRASQTGVDNRPSQAQASFYPAAKSNGAVQRPEPTYHPVAMSANSVSKDYSAHPTISPQSPNANGR